MCCLVWPRSVSRRTESSQARFSRQGRVPWCNWQRRRTYVRIQAPSMNENDFVDRKGFHSINVEAVCSHNGREHKAKINESFMLTMWLPSRKIFIQGKGLVMEAIFWEVTTFLLFCFCFFFSVEWRFSHLSFTSWTVRFAFPTAFTCFVISSHICFFYLLVMLFVNFDWIISIFLRILSVMRDIRW